MEESKKKPEDEKPEEKKETPAEPPEEKKEEQSEAAEKVADDNKADENEKGTPDEEKPEEKSEPENKSDESSADDKDEEILRLKTQIAAMQLGVSGDCMEDAVAIAESYVKSGKAADINAALTAVVNKYPDMKADSKDAKKGGFKVGADSSPKPDGKSDERVSNAFGIKSKKK